LLLLMLVLLVHVALLLRPRMPYSSVQLLVTLLLLGIVGNRAIKVIFCHKHIWHVSCCSCQTLLLLLLHRLVPLILLLLHP
jgi:hypothetical protein